MKLPSPPRLDQQLHDEKEPTSPITARRRGFGFFVKRIQSPSSEVDSGKPSRPLSYQPRVKSSAARINDDTPQSRRTDSLPSTTPITRNSNLSNGIDLAACNSIKRKATPGWIQIDQSAREVKNNSTSSLGSPQDGSAADQMARSGTPASARSDESTPRAIPPLNQKRRQPSIGLDGLLRGSKSRQSSWSSDQGRLSRKGIRRTVSSPVESHPSPVRKEHIAGSKPVAPSFHPDAPEELKVKSPSHPVLLPFLSIPGVNYNQDSESLSKHFSPTSPADFNAESVLKSAKIKHQRPGIKVRIITWNQGNSVPKGNLEALLGRVGEYIAPQEGWDESSDEEEEEGEEIEGKKRKHKGMGVAGQEGIPRKERMPPLPHDDAHPYHVVVIAGQECPWGDGKRIATGVGIAGELGDLGRSKIRTAQHLKDKNKEAAGKTGKAQKEGEDKIASDEKIPSSAIEGEFPFSDALNRSVPSTPLLSVPATPGGAAGIGAWGIGGKGWSDMCEDWLCRGPLAQATATKGLALASKSITPSPLLTPLATPDEGMSPMISRATTPNALQINRSESLSSLTIPPSQGPPPVEEKATTSTPSNNIISQDHFYNSPSKNASLAIPRPRSIARRISLANRSREVLEAPTVLEDSHEDNDVDFLYGSPTNRPLSPIKQTIDANIRIPAHQNKHIPNKAHHRLGLHIPGLSGAHHVTVQSDGTPFSLGAYELVAKERCYMMYMAVYVWRGCLDRVVKTSQGHVKSGLLAGRVGNKGCVGISLKLGSSRLLFVNAHLAAHEGKIAERIANVEKIKKELKVDTFLPPEDSRNQANDVTEAFDYAFWMGDLNFRVDISRQHADWLLMKKQYQEALAFDQLTKVMKEQPTIFNGFHEAPITFPPTFKYDVLKTLKQKNEEKARKLKGAHHSSKVIDSDGQSIEASKSSLLPISSVFADSTSQTPKGKVNGLSRENESGLLRESRREDADDDASSFTSSAWGGSAPSASIGNPSDREERRGSIAMSKEGDASFVSQSTTIDPIVSNNTSAAEGHKIHGKVIKAKKRFFDVVHAIGNHTQRKEEDYVPEVVKLGRQIKENDLKKQASVEKANKWDRMADADAGGGYDGESFARSVSGGHIRSESYTNIDDVPAGSQIPLIRRRSSAGDISERSPTTGYSNSMIQHSSSVSAMTEEYERQPYDTSAKQRVPSWCDRVLWKSNIMVEEEEEEEEETTHYDTGSHGLPSRMGHAISNAIHSNRRHHLLHHKAEGGPSVTFATIRPSQRLPRSATNPTKDLLASPPNAPSPSPRKGWFVRRSSGQQIKRATTMDTHAARLGEKSRSSTDLPSALARSHSTRSDHLDGRYRTRKSSLEVGRPRVASPLSNEEETDMMDEHGKKMAAERGHRRSNSKRHLATPSSDSSRFLPAMRSAPATDNVNKRTSWWNDLGSHLPSFLTPQGAMSAFSNLSPRHEVDADQGQESELEELIGPKKGQIECMSYKSLDNTEMRALDGRSDHYPVIWVGTVGI